MDPQAQPQATPPTPTSAVDPSRSHENGTAVRLLRALAPWTAPAERSQESVSIPLDSRAASAAEAEAQTAVETTVSGEGNGPSAEGSPQPATEERRDDTPA